ncbi:hypothetical protein [Streptomyces sp. TRM49041]|uniref:hypothetical protein n=1 Tax=Streptomyces sp. TRM49041 TaxID=2603216 RepID=UPI0011ED793B|nr:hypothetical protein [Streptomyces sp. TRM49041]
MATGPDLNITFYDYLAPRLTAGKYQVHAEHELTEGGVDITTPGARIDPVDAEFEVRAVRFVLDESSVQAVYPPSGSSGNYRTVLPHITLNRSILPWEREVKWSSRAVRAPWMALLMFQAGELPDDPEGMGIATSRTVAELCRPKPEDSAVQPPAIDPDDLDPKTLGSTCRTIDVPIDLFKALIPRESELDYLTHVRDVYEPSPDPRADGEKLTPGSFAVVTGNRFPLGAVGPRAVHLVSLEGHDEPLKGQFTTGATHIRLAALWSWSFTHDPTGRLDPHSLLKALVAHGALDAERLALRLESAAEPGASPDADEQDARERLRLGYVPVPQRLLSGELSYAWYRGPCTPVTVQDLPRGYDEDPKTQTTADHALIYDKDYGVYDVSYACAWTLGRTLALADPEYSADLVRARRELSNQAIGLMALAADPARARAATPRAGRSHADAETDLRPGLGWLRTLAIESRDLPRALAAPQSRAPMPAEPPPAPLSHGDRRLLLGTGARAAALRHAADHRTAGMPAWLDRAVALHGIPFGYLVPDPRMLAPESLRLFRLDPGWIDALLNGARSVGLHTRLDQQLDDTLHAAVGARRTTATPTAGLLLRSALVPAWPEFDLVVYTANGRPLTELRRDRPAPDVLLLLFDDVPDSIVIREPGEGIHFGTTADGKIALRALVPDDDYDRGEPIGRPLPATEGKTVFTEFLRPDNPHGVLNLLDSGGIVGALTTALNHPRQLTASEFAIEMINSPLEQKLVPATGGRSE